MCLYPRVIENRKYKANKKNKGVVPRAQDRRVLLVPVGCGNCMECRKQKANHWKVRLKEDLRTNKIVKFVTLTFSDRSLAKLDKEIKGLKGYDRDNEIARLAMRRFLERWRKKYKKSVRHWCVTELGSKNTERLHIHGLLWTDKNIKEIKERWQYGKAILGDGKGKHYVNEETIGYIVKYISKVDKKHKYYKSKMFTSPGIGKEYFEREDSKVNEYKGLETNELYTTRTGMKLGMPVYYRNHLYSDEEREKLWLMKLDEQVRWVDGVKVDVSENDDEYYELLKVKREKNKRLGYLDNEKNWSLKRYENERRNIKKLERIEKLRAEQGVEKIR